MSQPAPPPRFTWAHVRTAIVVSGLGFSGAALGGACLDYAGEDWGACDTNATTPTTTDGGNGSGSGSGLANPLPVPTAADTCDAGAPKGDAG